MQWGDDATARSQRLDWTLLKFTNFEVTAFGYQNEVGAAFAPFGQTKNEFVIAGTQTMKAGGRVRVGSFSFGVAGSSLENAPPVTNLAVVRAGHQLDRGSAGGITHARSCPSVTGNGGVERRPFEVASNFVGHSQ